MKIVAMTAVVFIFCGCEIYHHKEMVQVHASMTGGQAAPLRPEQLITFTYRVEAGKAIFESDKVTLVYAGLGKSDRECFSLQKGGIELPIDGHGLRDTKVSCRSGLGKAEFHSWYENGTNTITFCGREVRLINKGATVRTKDGLIELTEKRSVSIP